MRHIEVLFRDSGASKIAVVKGKSTIRELLVSISSEAAYYERHQIMLDKKPANLGTEVDESNRSVSLKWQPTS